MITSQISYQIPQDSSDNTSSTVGDAVALTFILSFI